MPKYRILHQQSEDGPMIIDDIPAGSDNRPHGDFQKQEVYVPYYLQRVTVASSGQVTINEDRNFEGFVDLVKSDDVEKSIDNGTINGLQSQGYVSVIDIQQGDLDSPSINNAKFDTSGTSEEYEVDVTVNDGSSVAEDYEITIDNSDISSTQISYTDQTAGSKTSSNIASGLASAINNDSTLSGNVTASASSDVVNITTDKEDTPFTVSLNVTSQDGGMTQSTVATGRVVITGSGFTSLNPFPAEVDLTDTSAGDTNTFDQSSVQSNNGIYTDSTIVVLSSQHSMGSSSDDIEDVTVRASDATDSSSITEV